MCCCRRQRHLIGKSFREFLRSCLLTANHLYHQLLPSQYLRDLYVGTLHQLSGLPYGAVGRHCSPDKRWCLMGLQQWLRNGSYRLGCADPGGRLFGSVVVMAYGTSPSARPTLKRDSYFTTLMGGFLMRVRMMRHRLLHWTSGRSAVFGMSFISH